MKVSRPDLDVWLITGDGDSMSIGGNHLIHVLRRNLNINILMFNNEIYGLTKGQYSPTSPLGTVKKSTPMGSLDRPFNPIQLVLGSQATFVARSVDMDPGHLGKILAAAHQHQGTSFVEILQNCVIFNKDFYKDSMERSVRPDRTVDLCPGEPLIYGAEKEKGLRFADLQVVGCDPQEAMRWDAATQSSAPGYLMAGLPEIPGMPTPIGIFRDVEAPCYDEAVNAQVDTAVQNAGSATIHDLVYGGETWTV